MMPELLNSLALNLDFLRRMVDDLDKDQMVNQVGGVVNHPAWTLGHIVHSFESMGGELGMSSWLTEDWAKRFGTGTNLHRIICCWLRAFHAALYQEYLPDNDGTKDGTMFSFDPPFPVGNVDDDGEIRVDAIRPHHAYFVERIKQNRTAGRLDRIVCFNGKCVYECVWDKADGGQPICIFALNVYDWSALANTEDFPRRGCVGVYIPAKGRPADATTATSLAVPISNIEKLDPFGR